MRVYSTSRLSQLVSRAPTDTDVRANLSRRAAPLLRDARDEHIASLRRYCEKRASFYERVDESRLALAYAEFASHLGAMQQ